MKTATAYAPGHLTGLFQICDKPKDPLRKGSRGAGVSIKHGVTTKVSAVRSDENSFSININGDSTFEAPVSCNVVQKMLERVGHTYEIEIEHFVDVPITAGFGSSGGGALSLCLALNIALDMGMSELEAAKIAHIAEIECRTGLGSVTAALRGGFGVSYLPGGPGINKAEIYRGEEKLKTVYLHFGPISTKDALSDPVLRRRINEIGGRYVDRLHQMFTPSRFMNFSRRFAEKLDLISPRLRGILDITDEEGYICSMAMFGEVIFSVLEEKEALGLVKILEDSAPSKEVIVTDIDYRGARII